MKKFSFVIACYNSSKSLKGVVEEITSTMTQRKEIEFEIILVNDFSIDNTYEVITDLCQADTRIKGISLAKNFGQQPAMLAGFSHVTGDTVIYCDDDGQSPVVNLFELTDVLDQGRDMVWSKYKENNNALLKGLGSKVNDTMVKFFLKKPDDLYFGNFWVAKRFVIDEAVKCKNPFPYLGGLFLKITTNMTNVVLVQRNRVHGKTNYSLKKLMSIWLNGFTGFSVLPLRIALIMGLGISFIAMMLIIYLIYFKLTNPSVPVGYSSILSAILFMGGVTMILLGLLGEYIGRIYININAVPQYVIKQKINLKNEN